MCLGTRLNSIALSSVPDRDEHGGVRTLDFFPILRRRPAVAYVLPMGVFVALTVVAGYWPGWFPLVYVLKTAFAAVLLILFWPLYTRIRWTHLWLGAGVGVIGVVQWVGMEKLLMTQPWLTWTRMVGDVRAEAFRPGEYFQSDVLMWAFIAVRWLGPTLVVPVMEELFWRDFAWRSIASPNDFRLQRVGEYDASAFWIIPIIFATVHVQWLTAIVWALLVGWLLLRTGSLGACIVAHGVTNFLLGAYVLGTHYWMGWDEWFFW